MLSMKIGQMQVNSENLLKNSQKFFNRMTDGLKKSTFCVYCDLSSQDDRI